ncbi:hypothetical protein SNK05_001258 [Fusarium graminearum]|nr:unnamed protein product [Fusarium graminearum]
MMVRRYYGSGEDTSTASEEDDDFGSSAKLSKPLDSFAFKDDEGVWWFWPWIMIAGKSFTPTYY